jgi:CDP-diacylglycerol--glycerol-3-phosphate 3-phosphatidyltransferase
MEALRAPSPAQAASAAGAATGAASASSPVSVSPSVPALTRRARLRKELLNAPNLMTLGRIAMVPVYLGFLAFENRHNSFLAAVVFALAAITDWVDGWLARVSHSVTTLGKFLDPLADKVIVLSALVMLQRLGRVPVWVIVLILAREFLISGLRTLAAGEGLVIDASQGGKWKTSLQLIGIISLMLHYRYAINYFVATVQTDFQAVGITLLYLSLVPSLVSAVNYVRHFYMLDTGGQRG